MRKRKEFSGNRCAKLLFPRMTLKKSHCLLIIAFCMKDLLIYRIRGSYKTRQKFLRRQIPYPKQPKQKEEKYIWKLTIIVFSFKKQIGISQGQRRLEILGHLKLNNMITGDSKPFYVECNNATCNCTTATYFCLLHTFLRVNEDK